jgi:hypothetical protein
MSEEGSVKFALHNRPHKHRPRNHQVADLVTHPPSENGHDWQVSWPVLFRITINRTNDFFTAAVRLTLWATSSASFSAPWPPHFTKKNCPIKRNVTRNSLPTGLHITNACAHPLQVFLVTGGYARVGSGLCTIPFMPILPLFGKGGPSTPKAQSAMLIIKEASPTSTSHINFSKQSPPTRHTSLDFLKREYLKIVCKSRMDWAILHESHPVAHDGFLTAIQTASSIIQDSR